MDVYWLEQSVAGCAGAKRLVECERLARLNSMRFEKRRLTIGDWDDGRRSCRRRLSELAL